MCVSDSGFVKKKGVRDKGQKDLGNAKVAILFSDASSSRGAQPACASSLRTVSGCLSADVHMVALESWWYVHGDGEFC